MEPALHRRTSVLLRASPSRSTYHKEKEMSLQTIVVHIDDSKHCEARLKMATHLALKYEAHLIGLAATGWLPAGFVRTAIDPVVPLTPIDIEPARGRCTAALATFEQQMRAMGVVSFETRLVELDPALALAMHGMCSDLIVVSQARGPNCDPSTRSDLPEWVMLNNAVPVLVVPARGEFASVGARIAVAWNRSNEARRAIGSALPLLCNADKVHLLIVDEGGAAAETDADMAVFLARHGVNAEEDIDSTGTDAGAALVRASVECGADLLVMGAYGRSRLREMVMGGASRTVLESMEVPVWMAH
ncbi:universal stress protein [Massilia eurypsychrophila]|uniref:Universal stress protein n=2 Tax=Massilia eurypsychrophila TaxID=1485217 RepID=A0A2G8TG93_9BURK|nr:universal stress protein [Massilia eurypsychrophila]